MTEDTHKAPGFLLYREPVLMLSLMPDKDAAAAIKAACNYYLYGAETTLDGVALEVFTLMKKDIDRNAVKYEKICERNRANIAKRYEK